MCRWSRWPDWFRPRPRRPSPALRGGPACRARVSFLAAVCLLALATAPGAADDLSAYLERHGLNELLAVHLEQQLADATGEERDAMLVRLAGLYAELLETVTDPVRRLDLANRSRGLLESAPRGATDELRLALLRAAYRSAERTAESHRLRLTTPEEVEAVRAEMGSLVLKLQTLRESTEEAAVSAERRLARATGSQAMVLEEDAGKARALFDQATFLAAWSLYYQAWLTDRPPVARAAERLFAELLDLDDRAQPEDVTVDLRSTEAIARCILGMALCRGITASTPTALEWIALLDHPQAYAPLREQTPAWKMAILLEDGEYLTARTVLDRAAADGPVPLHWLRLAAVYAIEGGAASRHAVDLTRRTVTELATRGELEQVFDLAERYGVDALATTGFALRYVNGVLQYHAARELHGGDTPTSRDDVLDLYADAITQFEAARVAPDADSYPDALPDCRRLTAWCQYFRGDLTAARRTFELAAEELPVDAAAEALWMAIVCLDRLIESDPRSSELADDLAMLVARFLVEHPSSEHAPKLVLRSALASNEVSPEIADDLLAIPAGSSVYGAARRRAAQVLYRLFRDAEGAARIAYANRYLQVAVPLHAADADGIVAARTSDPLAFERFIVRARRILEVSLHDSVGRLVAARTVLRALDDLRERGVAGLDGLEPELTFRRLQERLAAGDLAAAERAADELAAIARDGVWSRLADRALFRQARRAWNDAETSGDDDRAALARVIKYGSRVVERAGADAAAFDDGAVLGSAVAVAEASFLVWDRSGDAASGRTALGLYERLLAMRPSNARFLRATALLSERMEKLDQAVDCWRTLVAGSGQGTTEWFEAKFRLVSILAKTDPERARAVMDQHRSLNPDFGPEPWGTRLRMLDERLLRDSADGAAPAREGTP